MLVLKVGSWYNKIFVVKEIFPAFYFVWWYYHVFTDVITYFHLLWQLSKEVSTIKMSIMPGRQNTLQLFLIYDLSYVILLHRIAQSYGLHRTLHHNCMSNVVRVSKIWANLPFSEVSVQSRIDLGITFS